MRTYTIAGAGALPYAPAPFLYYRGISLRETTGSAAALVVIYDSLSAAGTILDEISLLASESARENYGVPKIARTGLYVQIVSGAVAGSIFVD